VNKAKTNVEMEPSPDAPQRDLIPVPQVHQVPLCAASGSKLKGMMSVALKHRPFGICPYTTASFRSYR